MPDESEDWSAPRSHPTNLLDADFFDDPERTSDAVSDAMSAENRVGLLVDAPHRIDVSQRDSFPLVAHVRRPFSKARDGAFRTHAVVLAVDLTRGLAWVDHAIPPDPYEATESRTLDPGPPGGVDDNTADRSVPSGYASSNRVVDLRDRLFLPWRPSRIASWVLLGEFAGGPLLTELHAPASWREKPGEQDAELPSRITLEAPERPLAEIPQEDGVVLGRSEAADSTSRLAEGAFHLPHSLANTSQAASSTDRGASARTVPMVVVGTGQKSGAVGILHVLVKATPVSDDDDASLVGHFSMDLRTIAGLSSPDEAHWFWFVLGKSLYGPIHLPAIE